MAELPKEAYPDYWVGVFAGNIRAALHEPAAAARARLKDVLDRFTASPACHPETRAVLGKPPRPKAEALNDGYDLASEYKPCGNPECRAPLPKRDKRTYCDRLCKAIAQEYAERETMAEREAAFRERNPDYDRCPF